MKLFTRENNMEKKDYIITLDDNKEYALISSIEYNGKKYIYLVELENNENCIFAELVNDNIVKEIEDQLLLAKVIEQFTKLEKENGKKDS